MIFHWLKRQSKRKPARSQKPKIRRAITNGQLKITKETNIGELAMEYPELARVLAEDYGLHCVGCFASSFDTLEVGAQIHGMTDQEIDEMIKRLKKIAKEKN